MNSNIVTFACYLALIISITGCGESTKNNKEPDKQQTTNKAPVALNVKIQGDNYVGGFINLDYTYQDNEGDLEKGTIIQWYRDGNVINQANQRRYQISVNDLNKKITSSVKPAAATGEKSGNMTSSATSVFIEKYDMDYTVTATCSNYANGAPTSAYKLEIEHLDVKGKNEETILRLDSGFNYGILDLDSYIPTHILSNFGHNQLMRNKLHGKTGLVLVKCFYPNYKTSIDDVYKIIIPLDYESWKATEYVGTVKDPADPQHTKHAYSNSMYYDINQISTLHTDIIIKMLEFGENYSKSNAYAKKIIDNAYPNSIYSNNLKNDFKNYSKLYATLGENSKQYFHYKNLNSDVKIVSGGNYLPFSESIALQAVNLYNNENSSCSVKYICARFFPWKHKQLTKNPTFSDKTNGWSTFNNAQNGAELTISHKIDTPDGSVFLDFKTDHGKTANTSSGEISQKIQITNTSDIDSLFLNVNYETLRAGCSAFGGCFSSATAGFFICLEKERSLSKYCLLYADYSDSITLNNAIGNLFNPSSKNSYSLIRLTQPAQNSLIQIQKTFKEKNNNINISPGDTMYIGAIVSEFQGANGECYKCASSINVKKISLFEVR